MGPRQDGGTSIGAECSNQMQVAQRQVWLGFLPLCTLVQAAIDLLHPAPTSAKDVLTLCNLRWWYIFLSSTNAQNT